MLALNLIWLHILETWIGANAPQNYRVKTWNNRDLTHSSGQPGYLFQKPSFPSFVTIDLGICFVSWLHLVYIFRVHFDSLFDDILTMNAAKAARMYEETKHWLTNKWRLRSELWEHTQLEVNVKLQKNQPIKYYADWKSLHRLTNQFTMKDLGLCTRQQNIHTSKTFHFPPISTTHTTPTKRTLLNENGYRLLHRSCIGPVRRDGNGWWAEILC